MSHSKILYACAIAGLFACSNGVSAAVYDFGKLQTLSRVSKDENAGFSDDAFASSMNFDFTATPSSPANSGYQSGVSLVYSANDSGVSGLPYMDSRNQFRRGIHNRLSDDDWAKRSDKYTSITSPVPEPQTYAMILAGLALIGFTARRRNRNS